MNKEHGLRVLNDTFNWLIRYIDDLGNRKVSSLVDVKSLVWHGTTAHDMGTV